MVMIDERQLSKAIGAAINEVVAANDGLCMDDGNDRRAMRNALRDLVVDKLGRCGIDPAIIRGQFDSAEADLTD